MHARAVDDAATRLRQLRHEEWEVLGLASLSLALAVAATVVGPSLAAALFLGGVFLWGRGLLALWRRWDLTEQLAGDRDAYVIPEVLARASRDATFKRRHSCAALLRETLREPGPVLAARVEAAAVELSALVASLDDEQLELNPACAVQCVRLLHDFEDSPLLNPTVPPEELRSRIRQISAGFRPGTPAG